MKNDIYAEIKDKTGAIVYVGNNCFSFQKEILELFRQGYPDSFDEYDLEFIEEFLGEWERNQSGKGCLVAASSDERVGVCLFEKVEGPQDQWEVSYIFTKASFRGRGIGRILVGVQEELLKKEARISFAINPGILPEDVISYPFWKSVGFADWAVLPGYFRDDLSGVFLVKRNPYYRIGKGISKDSGWCPEMADSMTGRRISKEDYRKILHSLEPTPKEKWGLDLIGRENIIVWKSRE